MAEIRIYTAAMCPFCYRAVKLLEKKGVSFSEIDVTYDPEARRAMARESGGAATVPQVFVGDKHIGDCDFIMGLERSGKLDAALGLN